MKTFFICLLIALANVNLNAVSETQNNQVVIDTSLAAPFNQLHLSTEWVESYLHDGSVSYEYFDNEDVTLDIDVGNKISLKKSSLPLLEKQLISFVNGKSSDIPLLSESFGLNANEFKEFKQAGYSIEPEMAHVVIKGQEWLKTTMYTDLEVTHIYTTESADGFYERSETVSYIPLTNTVYYTFIRNRMYTVAFAAPSDQYADYEAMFKSTLENL
jgi:hypothetical protein